MMKVTAIFGHPTRAEEFEKYSKDTHLPLAAQMRGIARIEFTKFVAGPDGGKAASHRMAELYFTSPAQLEQTLGSPEEKATVADLPKFATGGVTVVIGSVEG